LTFVRIKSHWVFLLILLAVSAQQMRAVNNSDSLLQALRQQPDDSNKVLTLNELFKNYMYSDPEKAHGYATQAYRLAQNIRWENGVAKMANNLGVYHSQQGQYTQSITFYNEVLHIYSRRKDSVAMANIFRNIGGVYFRKSDFEQSTHYFERALALYQAKGDANGIVSSVGGLAAIKKEQGAYPEAQRAFLYVLRMQEFKQNFREVARTEMNIADIYQLQGDRTNAKIWYNRGHELADSIQDLFLVSSALNGLTELAIEDSSFVEARQLADSALATAMEVGDEVSRAYALINLGRITGHTGDPVMAEQNLLQGLAICREIGHKRGEVTALHDLGAFQLKAGKVAAAIASLQSALAITHEIRLPLQRRKVLADLSKAYASDRNFEQAYHAQADYLALNDSIFSAMKSAQVTEIQAKFRDEEQQDIIQKLNLDHAEDQLRIVRARQRNYVLFAGIFFVLLIAVSLYLRTRQNKAQSLQIAIKNKEIVAQRDFAELQALRILQINSNLEQLVATRTAAVVEAKRELDIFLYESAHALRRPITRITALVELANQERDEQQALQLHKRLTATLENMDDLLHKLIMVNESSRRAPLNVSLEVGKMVSSCISDLDLASKAKVNNKVPASAEIRIDSYLLHNILVSLLENAVSFHPEDPTHQAEIEIEWIVQPTMRILRVRDNGIGIPEEQQEKVFDMFYRGTARGSGQGLGLYIARKSAERIGASVHWVAQDRPGATFDLRIPVA
jgi:signal transduction histidine kinase